MKKAIDETKYIEISTLYKNGYSIDRLKELYNVSNTAIRTVLNKTNTKTRDNAHKGRKYIIDENYFETIDSKNKAYVLGLMYSDGCNYRKTNLINLELQKRDSEILEKIKIDMKSDYPIRLHELSKKNPNHQDSCSLLISCKKMSEDLEKLGVVQNKSLILKFPKNIDDKYLSDFIRGIFDGDGHIEWSKSKFLTICSTKQFCESLKEKLYDNLGIECKIYNTANKESNTKVLIIFKKSQIIKFLNYIYKNSELHIDRKYNKYLDIAKEMNDSLVA